MSRLATFAAAIESGASPKEAAALAKVVTVNFNKRGEWGPNMNAVWLFSNANIQGTRNVAHSLLYSPHKKQVWALMGGAVALGIMAGLMSGDDDDLLSDSDRTKSLTFKFGDNKVTIPMPWGYGFFVGMGQLTAQSMKHPEKRDDIAVRMAGLTMAHFSPLGNPIPDGELNAKDLVNMLPTAPKPFAQAAINRSFAGGPLYPESPFREEPDSEKAWRKTDGTLYDKTAKFINDATGGDAVREGFVSVSPESIKLGVSTITGGVGRLLVDLVSLPMSIVDGTTKPEGIPVFKSFYGKIDSDEYLKRLYSQADEAGKAYKDFRTYIRIGDADSAKLMVKEERLMISLGKMSSDYMEQISALRDEERRIRESDYSRGDKKLRLDNIEAIKVRMATQFNDQLKSAQ